MTEANSTGETPNPLAPYVNAATEVLNVIGTRGGTDGDPQLYGAVYGNLATAYLGAVGPMRPLGQADAHVLDVLRAVALLASGGVQAQRFRDIITAALAGSVHVEAAIAALNAARNGQNKPQAAPEPVEEPDDGHGFKPAPEPAPEPAPAEHQAELQPEDLGRISPEERDELRASDVDLLRWCLDEGADPWADLLEPREGTDQRVRRPGIEEDDVQARFDRLHGLLDTSKAPDGVTKADWQAAQRRVLPAVYGDRGPA